MVVDDAERRRETGAASARALLLTVLGEFVLPREGAWTGALVAALGEVGVEEKAARQALSRTAAEGLLVAERTGRRVRWALTPTGRTLLEQGRDRIYAFGRVPPTWDGAWLVLAVSVPESQRWLRHRLRTRLTWAGLGSPMPGLWLSPDGTKEKEVADVVDELGVEAFSFVGPFGGVGDPMHVVRQAWELDDVEARYREFLGRVGAVRAAAPAEAFAEQVRLVQEWRGFPFLDPALPADLLDAQWPGPAAAELFHRRHAEQHEAAQAHWDALAAAAAARA